MYERNLSYSYINTARSAISSTLCLEGSRIGEHPLVTRFMAGIRNLRPPVPKYPVLWKVSDLLVSLQKWSVSDSLKLLTLKLTAILAVLSVQRVHTLSLLAYDSIKFETDATYLFVFDQLKVSRSRPCFIITLPPKSADDPLRSSLLLDTYLERTSALRHPGKKQLLVSHVTPHAPVSTDTISRWIKDEMRTAGIDTTTFTAHSVRGSAASAACSSQASIDSVLKAGDWSGTSAFSKHYQRRDSLLPSLDVANALIASIKGDS